MRRIILAIIPVPLDSRSPPNARAGLRILPHPHLDPAAKHSSAAPASTQPPTRERVLLIHSEGGTDQLTDFDLQALLAAEHDRSDPRLIVRAGDKLMVGAKPSQKHVAR